MIDETVSSMPVTEEAKEAFNKVVMEILCEIEIEKEKEKNKTTSK